MPAFLVHEGREYYRLSLARPAAIELPFAPKPYPCLLWDHSGDWLESERAGFASALVASDCRYAVCGGVSSEQWHDDIDLAFIESGSENVRDARFLMTTWHTNEVALDVAWFFAWNTNFDEHTFSSFLIIELGQPSTSTELTDALIRAVTDSEGVVDELDALEDAG